MPLPSGGKTPWPPADCAPAYAKIAEWSAWYGGSSEELAAIYGGAAGGTYGHPFFGSESGTGGIAGRVVSAIQRWFWGSTPTPGQPRTKLHIPVASDIAAASAGLVFSEPPKITAADTATQDWLTQVTGDQLHAALLEAAEISAALSGVFLRVVWDREVRPKGPWLAPVHPDAAVPQWRYDQLAAVTFWRVVSAHAGKVRRHLERHEPGVILHGLYEGDDRELGHPVPLAAQPELAGLADAVPTGIKALTAVYVPNIRPNRIWRNSAAVAPYGRSDLSGGVEGMMDALDEVYSSWMRDIRLAKARLIVPSAYLQSQGRGKGAWFDAEQEVIAAVEAMPAMDKGLAITPNQFAIRTEDHMRTANDLFLRIISSAGYDGQTFGMMGDVATTATETNARERKSLITRDRKILYWRPGLVEALEMLLAIAKVQFGAPVTPQSPAVEFAPAVSVDPESQARTLQLLMAAEAASTRTRVQMLHPDWDKNAIDAEVAAIADERSIPADPFAPPSTE